MRKHKPVAFYTLLTQGKLWQYLADIDNQAHQMVDFLVEQMKATEDITEQLKTENQMEWIQRMNDIEDWAKTFVFSELIYI